MTSETGASAKRPSAPLASHSAFTPLLVGWTALLFGLATFVIAIAYSSGFWLPAALSLVAAIIGGYCGYKLAMNMGARMPKMRGKSRKEPVNEDEYAEEVTGRRGASIISTDELGSSSLDAPLDLDMSDALVVDQPGIDTLPDDAETTEAMALSSDAFADETLGSKPVSDDGFGGEPAQDPYYEDPFAEDGFDGPVSPNDRHRTDALGRKRYVFKESGLIADTSNALGQSAPDAPASDSETSEASAPSTSETSDRPADIDFSGGGSEDAPETEASERGAYELGVTEADAPLHQAQIIDLKDRDLKDLSLVQMVDRFAVGLDGHRKARANDPSSRAVRPSDPRIAQAIRDLPISDLRIVGSNSTRAEAEQTEAALREALEKLQRMSDPS